MVNYHKKEKSKREEKLLNFINKDGKILVKYRDNETEIEKDLKEVILELEKSQKKERLRGWHRLTVSNNNYEHWWFKKNWSKRHSLRLGENWSFGPLQFEHIFDVKFPNQFIGYKEGFGSGHVDEEMLQSCYKHIIAEIYRLGFYEYFEKRALPIFESFLDFSKQIYQSVTASAPSSEIHKLWVGFVKREDEWMNYVWMVFLLDDGLTNELKLRLSEIKCHNVDRLLSAMVAPELKTAAYKLKKELLELAVLAKVDKEVDAERGIVRILKS